MAKPTVSTEWAQDAAALKLVPTSAQRQFGWSTSDNTVSGNPVKPNLQNQNGWQNNVHQWIAWLAAQFPDGTAFEKVPRWQYIPSASSVVEDISTNGTNLILSRSVSAKPASETFDETIDFYAGAFGGLYQQMLVDFNNGLSWRFIDGSADEWIVKPLVAGPTGNRTSIQGAAGGNYEMIVFPTNTNSHQIYRNDIEVADFSGFTATGASPKFQACIYSPMKLTPDGAVEAQNTYQMMSLRERRYVSIVGPDHSIILGAADDAFATPLRLEGGQRYRVRMSAFGFGGVNDAILGFHQVTSVGDALSDANRFAVAHLRAASPAFPCVNLDQDLEPLNDGSIFRLTARTSADADTTATFTTEFRPSASFSFWQGNSWPIIEFETLWPGTYSLLT